MVGCSVLQCKSRSERKISGITFHVFPKDKNMKKKWIKATGRYNWKPSKHAKFCSQHFDDNFLIKKRSNIQLKSTAYPTRFLPTFTKPVNKMSEVNTEIVIEPYKQEDDIVQCRVCLCEQYKNNVSYLFEPWNPPWEGMEPTIAEDLMKITHIIVNDKFSQAICINCVKMLKEACWFIAFVQRNDTLVNCYNTTKEDVPAWPKPIQVQKSLGNDSIAETDPLCVDIKEEILSEEEEYSTSKQWNYDFKEDYEIKIETEELIQQPKQVILNGIPPDDDLFLNNDIVTNGTHHSVEENMVAVKEEPSEDDSLSDISLDCVLCAKKFSSLSGLRAHVIAEHSYKGVKRKADNCPLPEKRPKLVCKTCNRSFITATDLMVHETCHNKSICYSCNQKFDSFKKLTNHRKRECKKAPERLKVKTLNDVRRLLVNDVSPTNNKVAADTEENVIHCNSCKETFSNEYYLSIHREIHHFEEFEKLEDEIMGT